MRSASLFLLAMLAGACGSNGETTASSAQQIVGGYFDESAGPTVLLVRCSGACAFTPYLNVEDLCSGTLIGPNLVLTARHCVAAQINSDTGVLCSQSTFGAEYPASSFVVTPAKDIYAGGPWFFASSVAVDPTGDGACGHDIATLQLAKSYVGAAPMSVRIAAPPVMNEVYSAVGYGDDLDGGLGYRHRRDGLKVACVGTQCKLLGADLAPLVSPSEFMGQTGLCGGDSGGPAIGADGLLFGVTSRGSDCTLPIYERVDAHAPWLQAQATAAALAGGYEIPAWAYAALPADAGADAPADASPPADDAPAPALPEASPVVTGDQATGGCEASGRGPRDFGAALLLALVWLLRSPRKRSKSPA